MKRITLSLAAALAALWIAGCNSPSAPTANNAPTEGNKPAPTGKAIRVGMVLDKGGLGDKSFNDSAYRGLQRAESELGATVQHVESKIDTDYETNIEALAANGSELVIAVGLGMDEPVKRVAAKFPDVKFAIVDGEASGDNVAALKFKEEEGSFLAGFLAARVSKTKKLGFVGGMEIGLIKKFEYGFRAGAYLADPTVTVLGAKYTMNWDSTDKGKASAAALFGEGADIVYHAAGRAGLGVIKAAEEAGKFAIGVDSDQDDIAPGFVLTSMVKRVDEAVFQTIKKTQEGAYAPGVTTYDVKTGGISLTDMRHTKDKIDAKILEDLEAVKADLLAGKFTIPVDAAGFDSFKQSQM